jgi:hypothetical protein
MAVCNIIRNVNAYVTGYTGSPDFPTSAAFESRFGNSGGQSHGTDATRDAFIAELARPLTVIGRRINAYLHVPFEGVVAKFDSAVIGASADRFAATIDWGDGSSTSGDILPPDAGRPDFSVIGNHTYAAQGAFPVSVTVKDQLSNTQAYEISNASSAAGNQSETNIAIDPTNPNNQFVVSNDETGAADRAANGAQGGGLFAAYSIDGGVTWTPADERDHLIADGDDAADLPPGFSDPKVAFDQFGNLFLTYVASDVNTIIVAASSDLGRHFTTIGRFQPPGSTPGKISVDYPSIATGPGNAPGIGSVWVTFIDFIQGHIVAYGAPVDGKGQFNPFPAQQSTVPGPAGNFGGISVGPAGQVLVNWQGADEFDTDVRIDPGPENIYVSVDADGLGTGGFSIPVVATSTNVGFEPLLPAADINQLGVHPRNYSAHSRLAWDRSGGPHNGRAYLVYTDAPAPAITQTRIKLRFSDNDGATWSDPIAVDDTVPDINQALHTLFQPSVAVDQSTGDVGVAWYDTRGDANDVKTEFAVAVSSDGGLTFHGNVPVSAGESDSTSSQLDLFGALNQYGDYTGLAFTKSFLLPSWSDNSAELPNNPDVPQFDVAVGRIALAHVTIAPIIVKGLPFHVTEGQTYSDVVAEFKDADTTLEASDFVAQIQWGDGSTSAATEITQVVPGVFDVKGRHVYRSGSGAFPVLVTVVNARDGAAGSNTSDISQRDGTENNPTVAVDPSNPSRVFTAADIGGRNGLFVATSVDHGATWTGNEIANGSDGLPPAAGFAQTAFDRFGNLFVAYATMTLNSIVVLGSFDGGGTFSELFSVTPPGSVPGVLSVGRPALAVGQARDSVKDTLWLAFKNQLDNSVHVYSTNIAGLGSAELPVTEQTIPHSGARTFVSITTDPVGLGQALVTLQEPGTAAGTDVILTSESAASIFDAQVFSEPKIATDTRVPDVVTIPADNSYGITAAAGVARDRSNGPHRGRVYLVYTDAPSAGSPATTIMLRYSDDIAGNQWSVPVKVNDDTGGASHFFPAIAVDPTSGNVAVGWYDTRNDPANVTTQYFVALSSDGGRTFRASLLVSSGSTDATDPRLTDFGKTYQYGSYTSLAFFGGVVNPVWTDNSFPYGISIDVPQFEIAGANLGVAQVDPAPIVVSGQSFHAFKDKAITRVVATVTGGSSTNQAGDFKAIIRWGDVDQFGNPLESNGVVQGSNENFAVSGMHTYKDDKSYIVTVIVDVVGQGIETTGSGTATVSEELTAVGKDVDSHEGEAFTDETLATFTVADSTVVPSDLSASINWGDGTPAGTGVVVAKGSSSYEVHGTHAYAEEGAYTFTTTIIDKNGPSTTATGMDDVADNTLTATGVTVTANEGQLFAGKVASFTDGDLQGVYTDYTVTIGWGDGTPDSGGSVSTVIGSDGTHTFIVAGQHTYAAEGPFPINVFIKDVGGRTLSALSDAVVVDPPPTVSSTPPDVVALQGLAAIIAAPFNVPADPDAEATPLTAVIDWGDGSPKDNGTLQVNGTTVTITGSHTYNLAGTDQATVTLTDDTGNSATSTTSVNVLADVTSRVRTVSSGLIYNPSTQLFYGHITVTNISTADITGPLPVVLQGLPTGVTVANAAGTTGTGAPYISEPISTLKPGQSRDVEVQFSNLSLTSINYTLQVFDPPPPEAPVHQITATSANIKAVEGTPFNGLVATFTDAVLNTQPGDYTATIDWGDGNTSPGIITNDPKIAGVFDVSGSHTYVDEASLAVSVTVSVAQPPASLQLVSATDSNLISASADDTSGPLSMSADGRFVAFTSLANNLVDSGTPPQHPGDQVYVRDRQTGTTTLVSVDRTGKGFADQAAGSLAISPNGRYVAFITDPGVTNLVPQSITLTQLFVRDLQTNTTSLVSVDTTGTQEGNRSVATGNSSSLFPGSEGPVFSADGRFLVFETPATNLVANDQIGGYQLFVRDLQSGTTTLVSVNAAGTDGGNSQEANALYYPSISADGRYVAFQSSSTNLVANDAIGGDQVFVRDLQQGITTLVSVNRDGTDGGNLANSADESPQISAEGTPSSSRAGPRTCCPRIRGPATETCSCAICRKQ